MRHLLFSRDSEVLRRGALLSEDFESRLNVSFDTARRIGFSNSETDRVFLT